MSERQVTDALKVSVAGYVRIDAEARIVEVNDALLRMYELDRAEQVVGMAFGQFLAPENAVWVDLGMHQLRMGMRLEPSEYTRKLADGRMRHVFFWANPVFVEDRFDGAEGFFLDVTKKRRAEEAVRALVEAAGPLSGADFFRALAVQLTKALDVRHCYIGRLKDEGGTRVQTLAACRDGAITDNVEYDLEGTPCEGVVGKQVCYYPRGVQERFPQDVSLARMGIVSYMGVPLWSKKMKPLGLINVLGDHPLTDEELSKNLLMLFAERVASEMERLEGEAEKEAERARLELLFEHMLSGFVVYEAIRDEAGCIEDFRCLFVNSAFERLTGRSRKDAEGKRLLEFVPSIGRDFLATMTGVIETGVPMQIEFHSPIFKRDYEMRIYRPEPGRVALVFNDISERKKAEERALMAQKMEAIGRLAGGIAHDFNNLLTVISGHARLALGRLPQSDAGRENVEEILKAGDKASGLTTQLLAISKRQAREPEVLDLNDAIGGFRSILSHLAGQNVDVVMRQAETPRVRADRSQVEQLLLNLVVNARDAMPDGGRMSIETSSCMLDDEAAVQVGVAPGSYAMLAVRDTGVGIDPEVMPHIFEPFYTTKEGKGTGLGLSTVYGIAKQNGGAVTVESEVGRGACFRVMLPCWMEATKAGEPAKAGGEKKRVLLAEDQEDVRRFAAAALRHFGHQVIEAEDGESALKLCEDPSVDFDCLVTDIEMPEMRGTELAARVRALRPGVSVVLMSGYAEEMDADKGENGFGPPLRKPFSAEALSKRVQAAN